MGAFTTIRGGGAFTRQNINDINTNFTLAGLPYTPGRVIFCQPSTSATGLATGTEAHPYTDLPNALGACSEGKNDIVMLVGNGLTSGSARLTSNLAWSKDATHLIGYGAPSYNPRARISTLSGATAFANFITVTASGCTFANFSIFNDNAIAAQITWTEQGGRNAYSGVLFGGMGDGTSAHSTSSRIMVLGGSGASGENTFDSCTFGIDTSLTPGRDVANATIEFTGGSKRNVFSNCKFVTDAKATTVIHIKSSGTNPLETFQEFYNCRFMNPYPQSSGSLMAACCTLAANGNGNLHMINSPLFGITTYGTDATSNAQIYCVNPVSANVGASGGIAVVPA